MSKIQQQLAAIHLLTQHGVEADVSPHAIARATQAFDALAADIFGAAPGASAPTQDQKELLHAVLAGSPLGAGANAAHLQAIKSHMQGAQVTGVFASAKRAYLSTNAAMQQRQMPAAPAQEPPSAALVKQVPADVQAVSPADRMPTVSVNFEGLSESDAAPTHRRDGSRNLGPADFVRLEAYELYMPEADQAALAANRDQFTSLSRAAQEIATTKAFSPVYTVKLLSVFKGRQIRVWAPGPDAVLLNAHASGEATPGRPPIHVITPNPLHFNAFSPPLNDDCRRADYEACTTFKVPGDGNCLFYAVALRTNHDHLNDAYRLTLRAEVGDEGACKALIELVQKTYPRDRVNDRASAPQIFYDFAQNVAHNFRQDFAEDICQRPEAYAQVSNNRLRPPAAEPPRARL